MREGVRKAMAVTGCGLWMLSSLCPLFGGGAKVEARCHGDFNCAWRMVGDQLPFLELLAPVMALMFLIFFARLACAFWAPAPDRRWHRWRLAPDDAPCHYQPLVMVLGLVGTAWALWRAVLYPADPATWPYLAFWLVFASWFAASAWACALQASALQGET